MDKYKIFGFLFMFIFLFIIVIAIVSSNEEEILDSYDIVVDQESLNDSYNTYLYSIDNPRIVIDPYKSNYNTALIMFETDDYVSINVRVNDSYSYTSNKSNRHYILVYDLDIGDNVIMLRYNNKTYKFNINIDNNEEDAMLNKDEFYILNNNHIIVPTYKYIDGGYYTGFNEIDISGKIYYQYIIECGYNNIITEIDIDKYAIYIEDKIVILDRQDGSIIKDINVGIEGVKYINYIDSKYVLYTDNDSYMVNEEGEVNDIDLSYQENTFGGNPNYINKKPVRFNHKMISETVYKNVWLLNYKKLDKDIELSKEFNRIVIDNKSDMDGYIILDKLFDKRVYELNKDINYIYTDDLKGEYMIYYILDNNTYKSDKYIKF